MAHNYVKRHRLRGLFQYTSIFEHLQGRKNEKFEKFKHSKSMELHVSLNYKIWPMHERY